MGGNSGAMDTTPQGPHLEADQAERFRRLSRLIRHHFNIENVHIRIFDSDGNWLRLEEGTPLKEIRGGKSLDDQVLLSTGILNVADVRSDPRLLNLDIGECPPGLCSYIGRALETSSGQRIGVLSAWGTEPRIFTEEDLEGFEDIAFRAERELVTVHDLDRATKVQTGLLPRLALELPGYEISGFCRPSQAVGGDFYDWYKCEDGTVFTLADVMGKGIGAAILAATVRAVLRAATRGHTTEEVLQIAKEILEPDLLESGSFVTLIYGRLHIPTNTIRYIDAGHGLALHVSKNGVSTRHRTANYPIGLEVDQPWNTQSISMEPGDTLMLLSDGMLEIFNENLADLSQIADVAVAGESAHEVVDFLKQVAANSNAHDDVTALIIRRV